VADPAQVLSRSEEVEPTGKEKDDDLQELTTDVVKDRGVGDEEKENDQQA
jgi:hypothetical protein